MTKKAYRKILIQQVHLSGKYRAFYKDNKEEYVALLKKSFNVNSSTKLSIDSLVALVDFLNYKTEEIVCENNVKITQAQKEKLLELWDTYARDSSEVALMKFIFTVSNERFISVNALSKTLTSKVIAILIRSIL